MIPNVNNGLTASKGMVESASGEASSDRSDSDKTVWECRECGKEYQSHQGLNQHYKTDTNDCSGLECDVCGKDHFRTERTLTIHKSREHGEACSYYDERLADKQWYFQKYVVEGYSTTDIAELIGCSRPQAGAWKRKHGIKSLGQYKSRGTGEDNPTYNPDAWVDTVCSYCGDDMEIRRKRYNEDGNNFCGRECSAEWKRENWVRENHPRWGGGYNQYYGPNWDEQREKCVRRDQYRCQACGATPVELVQEPDAHHIKPIRWYKDNYDKPEWYEKGNVLDNLVTLCYTCHPKWEGIPLKPDVRE